MIKLLPAIILVITLSSCGNNTNNNVSQSDTTGSKSPDGMVNSNVISTDTNAYKIDTNAAKKEMADTTK